MRKLLLITLLIISFPLFATEVYKHDKNGNRISGDKQTLINAGLAGKRIAVHINVNGPATYTGYIYQTHGVVFCMMVRIYASNLTSPSNFSATYQPYSANFCTNGYEYVRHGNGGYWPNKMDMTWYVHD
jgi:hypothetical protein